MNPLWIRAGLVLLALTFSAADGAAIANPLEDIIVCVWEGPNGECG